MYKTACQAIKPVVGVKYNLIYSHNRLLPGAFMKQTEAPHLHQGNSCFDESDLLH